MKSLKQARRFFFRLLPMMVITLVFGIFLIAFAIKSENANGESGEISESIKIEIKLDDASVEEVASGDKYTEYPGVMIFYDGDEVKRYNITLRGRGNSTWEQPKKPYQIKIDEKDTLVGANNAKKWVLLADYFDASHLRNDLALYFARMINEKYANDGEFAELTINGEDVGLYYLTEKIKIAKNSVDIRDKLGILVEHDSLWSECEAVSNKGDCFVVKNVVDEAEKENALTDFMKSYNKLEEAVDRGDFEVIDEIIDMESFVQYYLVSEFTVNPDAYASSFFMYKDGEDDKIHAGPVWDFDFAFANKAWLEGENYNDFSPWNEMERRIDAFGGLYTKDGEILNMEKNARMSQIMYKMMDIWDFRDVVRKYYRQYVMGKSEGFLKYLEQRAEEIRKMVKKDEKIWEKEGFEEEVEFLYDWISQRFQFMDEKYGEEKF